METHFHFSNGLWHLETAALSPPGTSPQFPHFIPNLFNSRDEFPCLQHERILLPHIYECLFPNAIPEMNEPSYMRDSNFTPISLISVVLERFLRSCFSVLSHVMSPRSKCCGVKRHQTSQAPRMCAQPVCECWGGFLLAFIFGSSVVFVYLSCYMGCCEWTSFSWNCLFSMA